MEIVGTKYKDQPWCNKQNIGIWHAQGTSAWARTPVHWSYTKRCTLFCALTTSINKPLIGTISTHDRCFQYGGGGVRRGPRRNQSLCVCYKLALRCFLTCVSRYLLKAGEARWNDGIIALEAGANGAETALNKTDVCVSRFRPGCSVSARETESSPF